MKRRVLAVLAAVLLPLGVQAQIFSVTGNEPGRVRWSTFRTGDYQLVFPRGLDSLATIYGTYLQQYSVPLSASSGFRPNQNYHRPMPVILRTQTGMSNGLVAWAPRRMELYTLPDASGLTPVPWAKLLAIHEGRHVAQKQVVRSGFWNPFRYPFGELAELLVGVIPNSSLLEGDAVVAETALTRAGRGRSGDFLSEMRMFFDTGDLRSWYQWRYGSLKKYTPDIYRLGYLTVAGFRYRYEDPEYMAKYLKVTSTLGGAFSAMNKSSKLSSGKKLPVAWSEMMGTYRNLWAQDDSRRAPFSGTEPQVALPRSYTVYAGSVPAGGDVYAQKAGMDLPAVLVRVGADGTEETVSSFGGDGKLAWSAPLQRVFWSESVPDVRWMPRQDLRIRYYDAQTGRTGSLERKQGRYLNPAVSPDGLSLCAVDYLTDGSAAVVVLDARSGNVLRRWKTPDGFQPTEAVFQDGGIVFAAVTDEGTGLYRVPAGGGAPETLLAPQPGTLKDLSAVDGQRPDGDERSLHLLRRDADAAFRHEIRPGIALLRGRDPLRFGPPAGRPDPFPGGNRSQGGRFQGHLPRPRRRGPFRPGGAAVSHPAGPARGPDPREAVPEAVGRLPFPLLDTRLLRPQPHRDFFPGFLFPDGFPGRNGLFHEPARHRGRFRGRVFPREGISE